MQGPRFNPQQWNRTETPENKLSHNMVNLFPIGKPTLLNVKGQFFQQMVLGKLDIHKPKNHFGPLPYTIYKN